MSEEKKIFGEELDLEQLEKVAGGRHLHQQDPAAGRAILAEGMAAEILADDLAHKDLPGKPAGGMNARKDFKSLAGGLADANPAGRDVSE